MIFNFSVFSHFLHTELYIAQLGGTDDWTHTTSTHKKIEVVNIFLWIELWIITDDYDKQKDVVKNILNSNSQKILEIC